MRQDFGKVPVSLLLLSDSSFNLDMLLHEPGRAPVKLFLHRASHVKLDIVLHDIGIGPCNLWPISVRVVRWCMLPQASGKLPLSPNRA